MHSFIAYKLIHKKDCNLKKQSYLIFTINNFFELILANGPKIVVITNGIEGVHIGVKDRSYFHPSLPTSIANTLGAGDAFGSAFTAAILRNKSIECAMMYGLFNSASVVSFLDAKEGLL